jgi:hypothetical protein|tara:strand:- start:29 stop:268 length:240 start_codon:yes stop_codon:yes gene_type:complete
MDTYFGKTAMLKNTRNDQEVECEVDNVRKTDKGVNESLDAFVASNKIHMRWNGNTYVGNALGMEFTTPGPKQLTNKGRY